MVIIMFVFKVINTKKIIVFFNATFFNLFM